jgi:subfamily B ATP-binding cassette protein MsbA
VAAFAAMLVLALTTAGFAFLTGPALTYLLTGKESASHAGLLGSLVRRVPREGELIPAAIVLLAVVKGVAYLGQFYLSGLLGQRVVADLRRDFFARLTAVAPVRLTQHLTGDLLSRFSADVAAVELAAVYAVASYIRDGLTVIVLVASAFALNWRLALLSLGLTSLGAFPVALMTRIVLLRMKQAQGHLGSLAAQLKEGLSNLRTLQAFGAFDAERARFEAQARVHRQALVKAAWARSVVPGLMEVLGAVGVAAVLAWTLAHPGVRTEDLVSFLVALVLVYQPAKELGRSTQFVQQAVAAGERIFAIFDEAANVEAKGLPSAPAPVREVRLDGVRFTYGDRPALDGLSLVIPVGQVTALVGPSGAGKSTVTSLLLRFAEPQGGRVLLDGEPFTRFSLSSGRRHFGLVTQEPLLFQGSIAENLRLGNLSATLEELKSACRVAHAHAFIEALPQGYQTKVGERGVKLSGGQRQRLCLARALLSHASVLILDEATSSLDPQSEAEVQSALAELLKGRTALVIAHRLSTVARADTIHVMEEGRVVERGRHAELLERGGAYARLWRLQTEVAVGAKVA